MTLHKMRTGFFGTVTSHIRTKIKNLISACPVCKRTQKKLDTFRTQLGNPRFSKFRSYTSPTFLAISADMIGPYKTLVFPKQRGKPGKIYWMIIQCLVTKAMSAYIMEKCDLPACLLAFSTHAMRFRPPAFILLDAGSNFNVNRRNSLLEKLKPASECKNCQLATRC